MTDWTPPELPSEVDGVFVGGGHNSLVAAAYLARCGLDILVLEANQEIGGGVTTAEVTLPLFRHNLHAFFVRWSSEYRIWDELDLARHGARTIEPEVQNGVPFEGGARALLTYSDVDRSLEAIRALSPADADTYARLHPTFQEMATRIDGPLRFAEPLAADEARELLGRSPLGRAYLEFADRSAIGVILDAFESEPLRALIGFNVAVRGYLPNIDVDGTGYCTVLALPNSHGGRMIVGGSSRMSEALARAVYANGGRIASRSRVAEIEVENGRAAAVRTVDGRRVAARRFIASNVPADQTLLDLVGAQHLDDTLRDDLRGFQGLEEGLFGIHLALRDRPRFAAEEQQPELPHALNLAIGYESSDDLLADRDAIQQRALPSHTAAHVAIPTAHDPSQAPEGHHTSFGWQFVASRNPDGTDRTWGPEDDQRQVARLLDMYRTYAPGIDDLVLGVAAHSPTATHAHLTSMPRGDRHHGSFHPSNWGDQRPHPELAHYRTPIDGLYLCGASQHPGGSFTGTPGRNAAGAIADDLGVGPWWQRVDAREALRALED